MIDIYLNTYLACWKHLFFTKNRGLSKKHLYIKGKEISIGNDINTKVDRQLGERLTIGKKIGAPAHTIVRMLIEMVLNLMAELVSINTRYFSNVIVDCSFISEKAKPNEKICTHKD